MLILSIWVISACKRKVFKAADTPWPEKSQMYTAIFVSDNGTISQKSPPKREEGSKWWAKSILYFCATFVSIVSDGSKVRCIRCADVSSSFNWLSCFSKCLINILFSRCTLIREKNSSGLMGFVTKSVAPVRKVLSLASLVSLAVSIKTGMSCVFGDDFKLCNTS